MNEITINAMQLSNHLQAIIKKGTDDFEKNDYLSAINHYKNVLDESVVLQNLNYMIGLCFLNLNQLRKAKKFLVDEILAFPENKDAVNLLNSITNKINGKLIRHDFHQNTPPKNIPSISLVLIVKNEEKNLERCLKSYQDIVQEIIVVDTGSIDRTVEIAKAFGARVEYFTWTNDFAEARNESLKYATCDWILRTDADEYIDDIEKPKLLHAICSGLAEIYICLTLSSSAKERTVVAENVRLIKNHLGVKYSAPIHENIDDSASQLGLTTCCTNIEFRHTGYDDLSEEEWIVKLNRNIEVCDSTLKKDSNNTFVKLIKGVTLTNLQRMEEGLQVLEDAVSSIEDNIRGTRYLGLAYYLLIKEAIQKKDEDKQHALLENILIDFYAYSNFMQFSAEQYLYQLLDVEKAQKILEYLSFNYLQNDSFIEIFPKKDFNEGLTLIRLIEIYLLEKELSKIQKPLKRFNQLRNQARKSLPRDQIVLDLFDHYIINSPDRSAVKNKVKEKKWKEAYQSIILSAANNNLLLTDLLDMAICQTQIGLTRYAHFINSIAIQIAPDSAACANISSLIYFREKDSKMALEKAVEAFVLDPGNEGFKRNLEQLSAIENKTPVSVLKENGMKWIDQGKSRIGLFALLLYQKFSPDDLEINGLLKKYL